MQKAKENVSTTLPEKEPQKTAKPANSLFVNYDRLVSAGTIKEDTAQREILKILEKLSDTLTHEPKGLRKILGKSSAKSAKSLYIWGNVGRGKSMLMDLFFNHVQIAGKRRIHFHAFMQEVHNRIHQLRQERQNQSGADPVVILAQQIAKETPLLCFDELQANDVADATLLFRLFSGLFEAGTVIVSTSNHPPASLYTGGVQRERFAKFTALIEERMQVVSLSSPHDYRHNQIRAMDRRYFYPLGPQADEFVSAALQRLCSNPIPKKETLSIKGRKLAFNCYDDSIGRFTFHEVCEGALGAIDYLEIAKRCDTVILTGIPKLAPEQRNEAKRFVTLIDALYERKIELLATAAVPPEQIYESGDGSFEFARTVSRLAEMQSVTWGENEPS